MRNSKIHVFNLTNYKELLQKFIITIMIKILLIKIRKHSIETIFSLSIQTVLQPYLIQQLFSGWCHQQLLSTAVVVSY